MQGILSDQPQTGLFSKAPSVLDAVLMRLHKAEQDKTIKAVLLKINTPGGGVTVSDILYHELLAFKQRSGKPLFVQMMSLAASGGVYIALAGDHIQAHPSTITGSVGVVSISADLSESLAKLGAQVNVYKSGQNKDMGSPFKAASASDKQAFQNMIDTMAIRFYKRVQKHRSLTPKAMQTLKTAKIVTGSEAQQLGLVDSLGYLSDATQQACKLAQVDNCAVVSYRYQQQPNATPYTPATQSPLQPVPALELPALQSLTLPAGLYYLYLH